MTVLADDAQVAVTGVDAAARILVVDDDVSIRELVATCLQRAGFDVLKAASGEVALEVLAADKVDLVVLDAGLPGISGTDVVRILRQTPLTAALPVILLTGSGDEYPLVTGLGAGADDYLPKPIRLDELVARVGAHLRSHAAWSNAVEDDLRRRSSVVEALSHLTLPSSPERAAESVVAVLARQTDCDFVAVTQLLGGERLRDLATFERHTTVRRGGKRLSAALSRRYAARAILGPWTEDVWVRGRGMGSAAVAATDAGIGAGAPIYARGELVGLLWLGVRRNGPRPLLDRKSTLLAAAIDYASILSAVAGSALADRRDTAAARMRLKQALGAGEFSPVFQPIVRLDTGDPVGYEALTRFPDGTRPDLRFAEAAAVGLGDDYELAAIEAAIAVAPALPAAGFLTLNVSPGVVLKNGRRLKELMRKTPRRLVLELTEHVAIDDYEILRSAIEVLEPVEVAVDDAGAGYSSLRHILELRPAFAKLDISLVHDIDTDALRRALVAGLVQFAQRSGCHLIAEGVESPNEAAALRLLGVELAQGFLFGRPEPIAA
jgi:EAL domain-containing protein (putative c-di-GMP-specific phosphodiesterase class I)/DNA-binding response OmpR family regulator